MVVAKAEIQRDVFMVVPPFDGCRAALPHGLSPEKPRKPLYRRALIVGRARTTR
jgi:hypothetical protein